MKWRVIIYNAERLELLFTPHPAQGHTGGRARRFYWCKQPDTYCDKM